MEWTFGISEVTTWPWSFEEDLERYAGLGARAIELWEFKLDAEPRKRRAQLRSVREHGLSVSSFQAAIHSLLPTHLAPEPHDLADRFDRIVATLEQVAPEIPGAVFVLNTGRAEDGNVERAYARTVDAYRELAKRAESAGVRLALEALHPIAMNEDTFVWTLEEAVTLVEEVGEAALGICADAWNLAGQHDLRARLARCRERLFLAQLADYRRPRSFLDRLAIGDGALDLRPFLDGLRDAGYSGAWVLEIFSKGVPDSLYDGDLHAVVSRSRDALTRLAGAPPQ
jgi:sugar phosphate isomerase/epimerase